ncbi:MAG: hypothetical protein J0M29_13760 [Chitinophagales bacterium]|nr:hypothetical protein [Chitinophagales bacterium]
MKQVFLMLVFWGVNLSLINATYSFNFSVDIYGVYTFTIQTDNTNPWTQDDLVTWIFPDGQMKQKKITLSNGSLASGSNEVTWKPYKSWTSDKNVIASITKKGGTGNPSLTQEEVTKYVPPPNPIMFQLPESVGFNPGAHWQANHTWEFAPGFFTYMVVTYRSVPSSCTFTPSKKIELTLPQNVYMIDKYKFAGESVNLVGSKIEISNFATSQMAEFHHVFLKLFVDNTVSVGQPLTFALQNMPDLNGVISCSPDGQLITVTTRQHPHDPNQKIVNIKRICDPKSSTRLHYKLQFHNDGKAAVEKVVIWDPLANELMPISYSVYNPPVMNGLQVVPATIVANSNVNKSIEFRQADLNGLPGLGQNSPIYIYSQTIYSFEFDVATKTNIVNDIHNYAVITFYGKDSSGNYFPLDPISTNIETVYLGCSKPTFCKCFKSLFRPKKERPKP